MINITAVKRAAYIYLVIPFVLFATVWLNHAAAIIVGLIIASGVFFAWQSLPSVDWAKFRRGDYFLLMVVLAVWLFLSGVGGYAFQNWDHHSRNAVFRDLINYSWPVVYHLDPSLAT